MTTEPTAADLFRNQIIAIQRRITATAADRDLHTAGTWPPHVAESLAKLGVAVPPRPPATAAQIAAYDATIAAAQRELDQHTRTTRHANQENRP